MATIGTCSICGGAVTVPDLWGSVVPPVPTCSRCGAKRREAYGPVIDMEPVRIPGFGVGKAITDYDPYKSEE